MTTITRKATAVTAAASDTIVDLSRLARSTVEPLIGVTETFGYAVGMANRFVKEMSYEQEVRYALEAETKTDELIAQAKVRALELKREIKEIEDEFADTISEEEMSDLTTKLNSIADTIKAKYNR